MERVLAMITPVPAHRAIRAEPLAIPRVSSFFGPDALTHIKVPFSAHNHVLGSARASDERRRANIVRGR
jgi:hypothetical protein